jgi:hypothetical protein
MSTMTAPRPRAARRDRSHHHPKVTRQVVAATSRWGWRCDCGGASAPCVPAGPALAWRSALVEALIHARCLAA